MSYKIGSFNMYKFSYQSDQDIKKSFDTIAKIIINEHFDIIGMQEVFSEDAVKKLVNEHLNRNGRGLHYDYRWATLQGKGKERSWRDSIQANEGYAFVWNTATMELSRTYKDENYQEKPPTTVSHIAEPHIFNQYRVYNHENAHMLIRNPFYGRFKPKNGFCEIRLINTHIRFGKSDDAAATLSDVALRKKELEILIEEIYHTISNRRYGNHMPAYTFLLGDYNLNLKRAFNPAPYIRDGDIIEVSERDGSIQRIITVQDQRTSLKQKVLDEDSESSDRGYANNYDHFSYDIDRMKGLQLSPGKIDSVRKYCNDDFAKHRREISDHVPISMKIDLRGREKWEDIEWQD